MDRKLIGLDIGGTKCAVILGRETSSKPDILDKIHFITTKRDETLEYMKYCIGDIIQRNNLTPSDISAVGISCGGPLDSARGVIMSPPNLPEWDNVPIVKIVTDAFGIHTAIQNDANACALAEWKYGAGVGTKNMVFLTFGTGLGAGLVLNGKLYSGTNDNAGELGHIRLDNWGPIGYGKAGSFEGFCSGNGISQMASVRVREKMQMGEQVPWLSNPVINAISAADLAKQMEKGDPLARSIFEQSAEYLGRGLSIVIDLLNPEVIAIGSIYARNEEMMRPIVQAVIDREALPLSRSVCRIVPAALGESIGDYAALSVAADSLDQ